MESYEDEVIQVGDWVLVRANAIKYTLPDGEHPEHRISSIATQFDSTRFYLNGTGAYVYRIEIERKLSEEEIKVLEVMKA